MSTFIEDNAPVIVQGMTGHQGMTHTARMLKAGTNIVGGVNPRKAGTAVTFPGVRQGADAHILDIRFRRGQKAVQLLYFGGEFLFVAAHLFDEVDERVHLVDRFFALIVGMELALYGGHFPREFLRLFEILPHFRLFLLGFQFRELSALFAYVERFGRFGKAVGKRLCLQSVIVCFEHNHVSRCLIRIRL